MSYLRTADFNVMERVAVMRTWTIILLCVCMWGGICNKMASRGGSPAQRKVLEDAHLLPRGTCSCWYWKMCFHSSLSPQNLKDSGKPGRSWRPLPGRLQPVLSAGFNGKEVADSAGRRGPLLHPGQSLQRTREQDGPFNLFFPCSSQRYVNRNTLKIVSEKEAEFSAISVSANC